MWDWWAFSDFSRANKKLEQNLSPNAKTDSKKGAAFIVFLIFLGFALYYFSVYRCSVVVGNWRLCRDYSAQQILEAHETGKKLPSYSRKYRYRNDE
jgi:hypothetical protein